MKLAAAIVSLFVFGSALGAAPPQESRKSTNIPPQALAPALQLLAKERKFQIVYVAEALRDLRTTGAVGEFTPDEALTKLLSGTGLTYRYLDEKTVTIVSSAGAGVRGAQVPADQMRVAEGAADARSAKPGVSAEDSGNPGNQVVVEDTRIRPYTDANADIPRTIDDAQPYYIFDARTIGQSGASNLEDFFKQRLSMNTVAQLNSQITQSLVNGGIGAVTGNTSTIDLRGLGPDKTLILVNGRRMAGVNILLNDNQPDINGIPLSAVDRVEVLPASASGIYGGSAIGGVVNIILKQDYSGGQVRAGYDGTWGVSDSSRRSVDASYGMTLEGGRTHVSVNAAWSDSKPLLLQDRAAIYRRNLATILGNAPEFFSTGEQSVLLGSLPNIRNLYTPVPADTPGAFEMPVEEPYISQYGVSAQNPWLLPDGPLVLKDGTVLDSNITYIPAGTSAGTPAAELAAGLIANAGQWNTDFPVSTQSPTGLLRRFGNTSKTASLMFNVSRRMSERIELYLDSALTRDRSDSLYNPIYVPQFMAVDAPGNPFGSVVYIASPDASRLPVSTLSRNLSATLGLLAQLPRAWTLNADYSWSENTFDSFQYQRPPGGSDFAFSGSPLNFFVDSLAHPIDVQPYFTPVTFAGSSRLSDFTVRGAGPLPALPWGAPGLTVGLEHRQAKTPERTVRYAYTQAWEDQSFDLTYYASNSTTDSAYAEATVPLSRTGWRTALHSLSLQVSGRGERYKVDTGTLGMSTYYKADPPVVSYVGTTRNEQPYFDDATYTSTNYTIGLKYQPVESVTVRVSRATAFLPPTPLQLLKDPLQSDYTVPVDDPVSGANGVQVRTIGGGNPDLTPQSSRGFNAGIIWEPAAAALAGLRVNAEYYRIRQSDAIGTLTAQQIVDQESSYPGRVVRDGSGAITLVDVSMVNLYERDTEGWDLSLDHSIGVGAGRMGLHLMGSAITRLRNQYSLLLPAYEAAGYHPQEGGAAKYKANSTVSWEQGGLTVGWSTQFFSAYKQYGAAGGPMSTQYADGGVYDPDSAIGPQGGDTVPSQIYHDLYLSYRFGAGTGGDLLRGLTAQLGVRNIFAKVPPLDASYDTNFYISPYGDVRLRSYWLTLTKDL